MCLCLTQLKFSNSFESKMNSSFLRDLNWFGFGRPLKSWAFFREERCKRHIVELYLLQQGQRVFWNDFLEKLIKSEIKFSSRALFITDCKVLKEIAKWHISRDYKSQSDRSKVISSMTVLKLTYFSKIKSYD